MPDNAPIDPRSLQRVLAPLGEAVTLPGPAYTSEEVFAWEMGRFFEESWVCVGRSADLAKPGDQTTVTIGMQGILLTRDDGGTLHAFFNVCRHRGHELLQTGESTSGRTIQCPYHAWVYELDGTLKGAPGMPELDCGANALTSVRATEWHGFVFLNTSGEAPDFARHVGNLDGLVAGHEPARLVQGAAIDYDVRANWKLVQENYQECYHCSNIHPELCVVTPPDSGVDFGPTGAWVGGSMDLRPNAETMSLTGESGAVPLRGLDERMRRHVLYFGLFPNLLISLHPDYLLTHRLTPIGPDRTLIECRWFFAPEEIEREGFDPTFAVEFWDLTNRQDWSAIESVQRGVSSRGYRQGTLSLREDGVRQFDTIVAQGYLTGRAHPPLRDDALAEASLGS
jgi:Rieske 2Fe-2S family protein